jgi:hypothetical protein
MPRKSKKAEGVSGLPGVTIPPELMDQLVQGPMTAAEVQAVCLSFKKALIERAMGAELSHHLGYRPGEDKPAGVDNHRNGSTGKTVLTEDGPVRIEVPRDRDGSYAPILIPKHERRFTGFDDKIIAMYARGMTIREIQGFLAEQYGTEVSPEFIRKLPRQAHSLNLDSWPVVDLGKNWVGGTRPRLSWGRSSLYSRSQISTISRT